MQALQESLPCLGMVPFIGGENQMVFGIDCRNFDGCRADVDAYSCHILYFSYIFDA